MHLIWISLVVPGMLFVAWGFPDARRRSIWWMCLAIALFGGVAWVGFDLTLYLSGGGKNTLMRLVYAMIMSTDFPIVAMTIGSVLNLVICRNAKSSQTQKDEATEADD